jgi:transposase-like protein
MASDSMARIEDLMQAVFQQEGGLAEVLACLSQRAMEAEVQEHLQAGRHQRTAERQGWRNGYKPRRLQTRVGELDLAVPQVRGIEPYHPSLFARWQRSERALLVACAEMYFQGVSTRNVRQVLEKLGGGELSAMTVSRVAAEVDEKLSAFRGRRLDGTSWPYLMIDARYEKVRVEHRIVSQAVLVVVGFTAEGRREILDWRVGDSESEATWGELFRSLKDRGLAGVQLVVSDAHAGIRKALGRHFQGVAWQRCRVHFKRDLARLVGHREQKELMADLRAVLAPADAGECRRRGEELAQKWQARAPRVSQSLRESLEDCLTCLAFPAAHRRKLASTNLLENLMKQLKRRTRVVGIFPNPAACDRLTGALLLERHERWQLETRAYFAMDPYRPEA